MKIKLIGSLCMVSVMKAVKIVLYILDELKKCHFHDSFFPLSFQSVSFYFHFHTPAKCILLYSQFSMMGFIFSGKWTIRTLKIPIIQLPQRFIFGVSIRRIKSEARKKRESIGVFSPIKCCSRGRGYLNSAAWQPKRNKLRAKGCWRRSAISHICITIRTDLLQF